MKTVLLDYIISCILWPINTQYYMETFIYNTNAIRGKLVKIGNMLNIIIMFNITPTLTNFSELRLVDL